MSFFSPSGDVIPSFFFQIKKQHTHTNTVKIAVSYKTNRNHAYWCQRVCQFLPGLSVSPYPSLSPPPSSLPIPNSMIHTLALRRVDRVSNNLSEVWIPVGNHFMWSFRVQVASHPFLFTKTAQVNKLGAIFNLNNCREIHQLKRVTPHEFTYITVDKQAHEICK